MSSEDQAEFEALELRLRTILPEQYQDRYDDVLPVSMGSASLKYGSDGKVAWNQVWTTFCDLAMAGGPPHKGTLLEPGSRAEIEAQPDRYRQVVEEICRGVITVAGLATAPSPTLGWVRVNCSSVGMAQWLVRAIVMENVSVRCEEATLDLPAGHDYRVEKEIKNVITAIAKTRHYWVGHMYQTQQRVIADLFAEMEATSPLIQPALLGHDFVAEKHQILSEKMAETLHRRIGLRCLDSSYAGWLGVECPSVRSAVWMMRAMVVTNVLSRREGTVVFVPVNPVSDPHGEAVLQTVIRIHGFASARGIL